VAEPLVPHGGYVEIGVGYLRVILEDAARVGGGEAGLEVPVCVANEILAWNWALVACLRLRCGDHGRVPASQRRLHGSFRVFHFRHMVARGPEDGLDI